MFVLKNKPRILHRTAELIEASRGKSLTVKAKPVTAPSSAAEPGFFAGPAIHSIPADRVSPTPRSGDLALLDDMEAGERVRVEAACRDALTKADKKKDQGQRLRHFNTAASELIAEVKAAGAWQEYEDMAAGLKDDPWPEHVQERNRQYKEYLLRSFAKDMFVKLGIRMLATYAWQTVDGEVVSGR